MAESQAMFAGQSSADIVFQGGSINTGANWFDTANGNATGLPGAGDTRRR